MRKFLTFLAAIFVGFSAHAAEMVNVEYIHALIKQKWDITVPYNPKLESPMQATNMEYLLTAVDAANRILNGTRTHYGESKYATHAAADTVASIKAVNTLIKKEVFEPKFFVTTTPDTTSFNFKMSAAGTFKIDWGDGKREKIKRTRANDMATYSHTYVTAGEYTISFDGQATNFSVDEDSAISFSGNRNIAGIRGSLGAIFSTIGDGNNETLQPKFENLFNNCGNLTGEIPVELFNGIRGRGNNMFSYSFSGCAKLTGAIPGNLFAGISGVSDGMFRGTFKGCSGLTGEIPEKLFSGIFGAPKFMIFLETFSGCSGLTGEIPSGLFSGINGVPEAVMFQETFRGCSGLTGEIPSGLFAGISGAPVNSMFNRTFFGCSGLTGIADGVFGDLNGDAKSYMFEETFSGCTSLTGPSARTSTGKYLYEIWPDGQFFWCYRGATGLSDYADIPSAWK